MALFGASKRGLFGDLFGGQSPYQTPGIGDGLPGATTPSPEPQFEPGTGMFGGAARRPSKWDRIGEGLGGLAQGLGAAQAFWDGDFGTGVGIQQMQQERRDKAQQAAVQEQNIAARYQRAIAAGMTPAQAAIIASGDAKFSDIFAKPTAEQQNFQTWRGFDPATRAEYGHYQDVVNPRFTNTPAGTQFIPRVNTQPTSPVGKLTPIPETVENTPAPELGSNGLPASLTPDQYRAVVNSMGKAETDAWLARNNIRVGN